MSSAGVVRIKFPKPIDRKEFDDFSPTVGIEHGWAAMNKTQGGKLTIEQLKKSLLPENYYYYGGVCQTEIVFGNNEIIVSDPRHTSESTIALFGIALAARRILAKFGGIYDCDCERPELKLFMSQKDFLEKVGPYGDF